MLGVEADRPRCVTWRMDCLHCRPGDLDGMPVGEVDVPELVGVGELPHRAVVGVQEDRRPGLEAQLGRDADMVVMGVGAQDRLDPPAGNQLEDGRDVVRRIDHDALVLVA